METKLTRIMSSKKTTLILLVIYAILMAAATIVEKFYGTAVAKAVVYYSPLFIILHLLMVINFFLISLQHKLFSGKKWSYMVIHLSFLFILTGATITHFMGKEGMVHLREGEKTDILIVRSGDDATTEKLPFEIELTDFNLIRYPGSQSPSSYESYIKIHDEGKMTETKIYMNNVLDLKGYRFFQASYDEDELGSILSVNYDATGRRVTYTGYTLLFLGLILMLFDNHSRFRRLWNKLNYALILGLFLVHPLANEASAQNAIIPAQHAQKFGYLPMQSANGRITPVSTFASEIVRKFKAKKVMGDLKPEQLLLSIMVYPADWANEALIEIKEYEIADKYGWTGKKRISYKDAFNEKGQYKLYPDIEDIYRKNPSERNRFDKEVMKIDDRVNIIHELLNNRMLRLFPDAKDTINHRWMAIGELFAKNPMGISSDEKEIVDLAKNYFESVRAAGLSGNWTAADSALQSIAQFQQNNSDASLINNSKLKAEVLYNDLNLFRLCRMGYLILGAIMLILAFRHHPVHGQQSLGGLLQISLIASIGIFFILHTLNLGMRWYISGYAPWSNSYETMVSLAWAGVLCGFIFVRRNRLVTALATLFGGAVLFVSGLSWMEPQITPLVPVLKSPWLMAHVASLVMAYGFLGISCMIGTAYLFITLSKKETTRPLLAQLTIINELSMLLGVGLLTIGIFLGAIWANESWGRYWSWDPKETWALITMVVYTTVLHFKWFSKSNTDRAFNLFAQLSFLSILMTFLGVNYFLSGMHSYGSSDALSSIPWWAYTLFILFFTAPAATSYLLRRALR